MRLILLFVCGMNAVGIGNTVPIRAPEKPHYYSNTSIRVLLEQGIKRAGFSTLSKHLWVRYYPNQPWKKVNRRIDVLYSLAGGQRKISIDGKIIPSDFLAIKSGIHGGLIRYRASDFHGEIHVFNNSESLEIVNTLPLEEYLLGTLQAETIPSWNLEALKAQAIASRSYAYYMTLHPKGQHYDLSNSILDQVYRGDELTHLKIQQAVSQTEGELLYNGNAPAKAFFHSRCGGKTEGANQVWQLKKSAQQNNISCPFCQLNRYEWKTEFPKEFFRSVFGFSRQQADFSITAHSRSPSGRIAEIKIGPPGNEKILTGDKFRSLLGYQKIKSTHFRWQETPESYVFFGIGAGHGVGMCQWGAAELAKKGKTYRQILAHYYPKLRISDTGNLN